MPHPGVNPNEADEAPDAKFEVRRISVVVYEGGRCAIDKPNDMMATEALALLASATAEVAGMQFHAMQKARNGTKIVRPLQHVVVPNRGRPRP